MKRIFEIIGMITLVLFSFFYTSQISTVIRNNDDLMVEINNLKEQFIIDPIEAVINENTIIPGLSGKDIDVNKSYRRMKQLGSFNDSLLVYKDISPENRLKDNYNKYIVRGNPNKKEVSLIFLVNSNSNINNIRNILNQNEIKANFFVDGFWFENNNQIILDLVNEGHIIGNLSYNLDYKEPGFVWMNTIITKIAKQKNNYCYNEIDNQANLNICALNKSHTIRPNIIVKNNPLIEIKANISNGSIISLKTNKTTEKELQLIINYINSKDLKIVNLENLLKE